MLTVGYRRCCRQLKAAERQADVKKIQKTQNDIKQTLINK